MDKKKLHNRFSKIRSKNGKTSKFIAMAVFAIIIVYIICVSILVAVSRQDDMILYENEAMNFKLEIPLSWQGKYIVDESAIDDNYIAFKHKEIAEKHDGKHKKVFKKEVKFNEKKIIVNDFMYRSFGYERYILLCCISGRNNR